MSHFCTPLKRQKIFGFLIFYGETEMESWAKWVNSEMESWAKWVN